MSDVPANAARLPFDNRDMQPPETPETAARRLSATQSVSVILRHVKALADDREPRRSEMARLIVHSLLSADNVSQSNRRVALFLMFVGIMDGSHGQDSIFYRFLSIYPSFDIGLTNSNCEFSRKSSIIILRLIGDSKLRVRLSPSAIAMLILFFNFSEGKMICSIKLRDLMAGDPSRPQDISWPLALRIGLFMLQRFNPFHRNNPEVPLAVATCALSDGHHDRSRAMECGSLIARASALSGRLAAVAIQAAFEADPERGRSLASPLQARFVRPPPATGTVLEGDGSEFIGYRRDPRSGKVTSVERERPRLVSRRPHHRDRFRWNNEPVVRARFSDATVTPTGLILFGDDALLEYEFANQANWSGYAIDAFQIHHHSEILLSTDRSAIIKEFESIHVDSAVLLSGLANLENFGHFIINGIFKLSVYDENEFEERKIVLPTVKHHFQEQILKYCGYPSSSFVFTEKRFGVFARRLDVLEEAPHGLVAANLAETFRERLPRPRRSSGPRRIYVARPRNAARPLTNEAAIVERLVARDFQILRPEELPFHEQVSAFEAADVIVAPHGSALFNLWFCFGQKRIVEIRTKIATPASRYALLGHQVMQVSSNVVEAQGDARRAGQVSYEADLTALFDAVEWALGGQ